MHTITGEETPQAVLITSGAAYTVDDKALYKIPQNIDGSFDAEWGWIDFDCISEEEQTDCRAIMEKLEKMNEVLK